MLMFILGFVSAWGMGAFFAILFDNECGSGIELFDGWGATLLLLPALIVIYLIGAIYRAVKKLHKKNS